MNIEETRDYIRLMREERVSWLKLGDFEAELMPDAYEMPLIEVTKERVPAVAEKETDPVCSCGKPLGRLLPGLCDKCALAESGIR